MDGELFLNEEEGGRGTERERREGEGLTMEGGREEEREERGRDREGGRWQAIPQ